jgi:hypothetical protein
LFHYLTAYEWNSGTSSQSWNNLGTSWQNLVPPDLLRGTKNSHILPAAFISQMF